MIKASPLTLGVDLGQRTLKGVTLKRVKDRVILDNFFYHDLAESSENFPNTEKTFQTLSAIVDLYHLNNVNSVCSLYCKNVDSFDVLIPDIPYKEIRKALRHEVKNHIDYPIDECIFDFIELGQQGEEAMKSSEKRLKVYHSKIDSIQSYVEKIKAAPLKPIAVDLDATAIVETLRFNNYLEKGKIYISIDFGESHTTVSLIAQQQVTYFNSVPASFGSINRQLGDDFNLSYSESEIIKKNLHKLFNKENVSEIESKTEQSFLQLLKLIYETIDYYISQVDGARVSEFLVTGGGSKNKFILDLIEKKYGARVTPINPFRNIDIFQGKQDFSQKIDELSPYLALAVGLGLWEGKHK